MTPLPLLVAALLALAACAPRGVLTVYPSAAATGVIQPILVATPRGPNGGPNGFDDARGAALTFAAFEVAVPPERAQGTVTFPSASPPDPRTDFATVSARNLGGEAAFVAALNARLAASPPGQREVFLFTHGFNTTFAEGLYRQAQMRHDFATPGVSVHYGWPSAGALTAYAADRESAIFARDGLARTLEALGRSDADRIVVAAHSMGALVMMEALRSLAIAGSPRFFAKLQAIVLMAPDLDVDVFRGQVAPLEALDVPVYVFFSSRDRALRASAFLRGRERLGAVTDLAKVEGLPITLIDTSGVDDGADALGHFAVATSPTMIAIIRGMDAIGAEVFADAAQTPNPFEATIYAVQGVGEAVLSPLAQ
jgi:esterase/lipase superfamily enzyme